MGPYVKRQYGDQDTMKNYIVCMMRLIWFCTLWMCEAYVILWVGIWWVLLWCGCTELVIIVLCDFCIFCNRGVYVWILYCMDV